ncbi:hypothetical protein ED21_23503 [Erythrobacter sp. SD-21]|nr:hypothetical protein ED21_23503 [Erythrobacter sp. SD-21]
MLALTGATLFSLSPLAAQGTQGVATSEDPGVAQDDAIDIAFDRDRYERMTVPVSIDGRGPYRFFIDTGAQATVVTSRITSDLELEPSGRALLVAMGSKRMVDTIAIDRLEFADRTLSGLTSPLLERKHVGADGILGLDTLQDMRVLIDFAEQRMTVMDAEQAGGRYGYEIVVRARERLGQMIITNAKLDGVKIAVIIDTGAQNSVGNLALLSRLRAREGAKFTATDVNGFQLNGNIAYGKRLQIAEIALENIPIGFADSPALEALGFGDKPALILGMGNLRVFERIAIDFASRRVMFDLPGNMPRESLMRFNQRATRLGG